MSYNALYMNLYIYILYDPALPGHPPDGYGYIGIGLRGYVPRPPLWVGWVGGGGWGEVTIPLDPLWTLV